MNPIVPSFGYAVFTTGPPASLTRSSVPRFVIPIHAEPSASARTTSLFCDASFRTFGFNSFRKSFAARDLGRRHRVRLLRPCRLAGDRHHVGRDVLERDLALVLRVEQRVPRVRLRLDVLRVVVDLHGRPRERIAHVVRAVLPEREVPRDRVELLRHGSDERANDSVSPSLWYFGTQSASPDTMSNWLPVCLIFRYASALSLNSVGRPWIVRLLLHGRQLVVRVVVRPGEPVQRDSLCSSRPRTLYRSTLSKSRRILQR